MRLSCDGLFQKKFVLSKCQRAMYVVSTCIQLHEEITANNIYLDW